MVAGYQSEFGIFFSIFIFEFLMHDRWQVNIMKYLWCVWCHLCSIFNLLSLSKFCFTKISYFFITFFHSMLTFSINFPLRTLAQKQSYRTLHHSHHRRVHFVFFSWRRTDRWCKHTPTKHSFKTKQHLLTVLRYRLVAICGVTGRCTGLVSAGAAGDQTGGGRRPRLPPGDGRPAGHHSQGQ